MSYTSRTQIELFSSASEGTTVTLSSLSPTPSKSGIPAVTSSVVQASPTSSMPDAISANWGNILRARLSENFKARLTRIAGRREPGLPPLASRSLAEFLEFWLLVRPVAVEPEVSVAPDGNLMAEWFRSTRYHLDLRFVPGRVIFGLISGANVSEGSESLTNLPNVANYLKIHSSQPLKWSP
jgi:hypothetical protein